MPDVAVSNTSAALSGKELTVNNADGTITALHTFNRGSGSAPFAVNAGAAAVSNLDADKLDGSEGAEYAKLADTETVSAAWTFSAGNTFSAANTFSHGDNTFKAGASTETHKSAGIINVDSTQAATGANTTDTTLFTYTLPANALNANGRTIRFTAWGTFGATANNKTVRLESGGISGDAIVAITTAANAKAWLLQGLIIRTGSSTQDLVGWAQTDLTVANSDGVDVGTGTQTDSGAIDLVVTSQNGTAAANDCVYEGSIIEFLN